MAVTGRSLFLFARYVCEALHGMLNESRLFLSFFIRCNTHKWANKLNSRTAPFSLFFLLVLTMSSSSVFDITFGKTPRKQKKEIRTECKRPLGDVPSVIRSGYSRPSDILKIPSLYDIAI